MTSTATSHSHLTSDARVVIAGGGLAGIAAAVRLAHAGVAVTLVETRKRLGGRATSFVDPSTGQVLDNCQHVLLGCCTTLTDLYARLGVADKIQWHRKLYFSDGHGGVDVLQADDMPAPMHLSRALLAFRGLSWAEKIAISRAMTAIIRLPIARRAALNNISFLDWLHQQHQPQGAVDRFWSVIVISAINETPARMGADYALQVFQEGMLAHRDAYVMGVAAVPLVELYDAAERVITSAGGGLLLSTSAEGFDYDATARRVTALRIDGGQRLEADAFVSAVPFDRLAKLSTLAMLTNDARLQQLDGIGVSPILGIHMFVARDDGQPVMTLPHLILTDGPLQWIFNKGQADADAEGAQSAGSQHLHGVISAARDWVDVPAEAILDMAMTELRKALPAARDARLSHGRVIKEKRATFAATPGLEALRPPTAPVPGTQGIDNLLLAGDWVATGWPATMEGAARSGYTAADATLKTLGRDEGLPLPADLPASPLYRLIAGLRL